MQGNTVDMICIRKGHYKRVPISWQYRISERCPTKTRWGMIVASILYPALPFCPRHCFPRPIGLAHAMLFPCNLRLVRECLAPPYLIRQLHGAVLQLLGIIEPTLAIFPMSLLFSVHRIALKLSQLKSYRYSSAQNIYAEYFLHRPKKLPHVIVCCLQRAFSETKEMVHKLHCYLKRIRVVSQRRRMRKPVYRAENLTQECTIRALERPKMTPRICRESLENNTHSLYTTGFS